MLWHVCVLCYIYNIFGILLQLSVAPSRFSFLSLSLSLSLSLYLSPSRSLPHTRTHIHDLPPSPIYTTRCHAEPGPPCQIQSIYLLNFQSLQTRWLADYLLLFPVFVVATSYPLIAITARNNVQQFLEQVSGRPMKSLKFRSSLSLLVSVPPILLAVATSDAAVLISFTGERESIW